MKPRIIALVAVLAIALAACGHTASSEAPSTEAPVATLTEASTTTQAPTTTVAPNTTTAVAKAAPGVTGEAPTAMSRYAVDWFETEPLGIDMNCEGMANDFNGGDEDPYGIFTPEEWAYVSAAIEARSAQEGCPVA
jgi:hypothetical protein